MLEYRSIGVLGFKSITPLLHNSITPVLFSLTGRFTVKYSRARIAAGALRSADWVMILYR